MKCTVQAGPRLHCTLLDLGRATSRAYGGCGFMIDGPIITVSAEPSDSWSLASSVPIDDRSTLDLRLALDKLRELAPTQPVAITVHSIPPQHVGLGTKTSMMLSSFWAASTALRLSLTREHIQQLCGRGGTSGVGIHGFFEGGFVADAGHPQEQIPTFAPSSARKPQSMPYLARAITPPASWRFHLILSNGSRWDGVSENAFFGQNTPLHKAEVFEAISIVYHDLVPGVGLANLDVVRASLNRLHEIGFKAKELASQSTSVRATYTRLREETRGAVGMSSLGPLLYVILDREQQTEAARIRQIAEETQSTYLGHFGSATNRIDSQ
jgi:beta-ribofuranosylaminobenzene 5'-phosphate synthase